MADLSGWAHCVNWHLASQVQIFSSKCVKWMHARIYVYSVYYSVYIQRILYTCVFVRVFMCACIDCVRVCGSDWASVCGRQGGSCIWWCCAFVCVRDICIQGTRNFQKFWAVRVCVLARNVSDVTYLWQWSKVYFLLLAQNSRNLVNCPTMWYLS